MIAKDIKKSAEKLTQEEVRILVDNYYRAQQRRIRIDNQIRSLSQGVDTGNLALELSLQVEADNFRNAENINNKLLKHWAAANPLASIAMETCGIAHILASGLAAHVDLNKLESAGKLWAYAGFNPEVKWEKGKLRPWNASLKKLCFLMGESFIKVKNNPKDIYGKVYQKRKDWEALKHPELKKGHIHNRSRRYAIKLFLADIVKTLHDRGVINHNPNNLFPMTGAQYLNKL